MTTKNAVILSGAQNNETLTPALSALMSALDEDHYQAAHYDLNQMKLAHCTGCFGCWVKTPGECVAADKGREIARAIVQSDLVVLVTPVTFGGYGSALKAMVDRFIPMISPFFMNCHGETHHKKRYDRYPRLVGIGVAGKKNSGDNALFKTLVGRNAINFHAPSFAADVVSANAGDAELKDQIKAILKRTDPVPKKNDILAFYPKTQGSPAQSPGSPQKGHALFIVGSPKLTERPTSQVLGQYLLDQMGGWTTQTLTLKRSLLKEKGQNELIEAADHADLIILGFPLYIDTLPFLVVKALEVLFAHRQAQKETRPQKLFVLANNGFPEAYQNTLALAVCHRFADRAGSEWAGALALGAGEALGNGHDLAEKKRPGPPVFHVMQALNAAARALSRGDAVPDEAQTLLEKSPIPLIPQGWWYWMFRRFGGRHWVQRAATHGVKGGELFARPYSKSRSNQ